MRFLYLCSIVLPYLCDVICCEQIVNFNFRNRSREHLGEAGCGIAAGLTYRLICGQPQDDFMISDLRLSGYGS
jgi:hypothetical protein